MKGAVLLLGHGSRIPQANEALYVVAEMVKQKGDFAIVKPVFLQFVSPTLIEGMESCLEEGVDEIYIHPYFLYPGAHVLHDIPSIMANFQQQHPHLRLKLTQPLGVHEKLAEVVIERIEQTKSGG